ADGYEPADQGQRSARVGETFDEQDHAHDRHEESDQPELGNRGSRHCYLLYVGRTSSAASGDSLGQTITDQSRILNIVGAVRRREAPPRSGVTPGLTNLEGGLRQAWGATKRRLGRRVALSNSGRPPANVPTQRPAELHSPENVPMRSPAKGDSPADVPSMSRTWG